VRIPVLAILRRQEPLVASAFSALTRQPSTIPLEAADTPRNFHLDNSFLAVPIGTGSLSMSAHEVTPEESQNFAVRGFVDFDDKGRIPAEMEGTSIFADPQIEPFITCINDGPIGNVNDVQKLLNTSSLLARGLDGSDVAIAIMDTGINVAHLRSKLGATPRFDAGNSWQDRRILSSPGAHLVGHGTMCAFNALISAPRATLLDFPILSTSSPGGSISGSTLSTAVQAFAQLIAFWGVAFSKNGGRAYKGLVVNNSWGVYNSSWDFPKGHPGRYIDNPYHPFNLLVSVLARSGADIIFAAGNCGGECPDGRCKGSKVGTIMGANASQDVLTLAGCDVSDSRVGYSSQGPSIAGMYPSKPDITAYTHFLGSEALGPGTCDSGTSTSCPVAAGCVAAIRTKVSPSSVSPGDLFSQLRATARTVSGGGGWNANYGFGILDADMAASTLGV